MLTEPSSSLVRRMSKKGNCPSDSFSTMNREARDQCPPEEWKQIFMTIGLVFSRTLSMDLPSHSGLYRIIREEYGAQALQAVRYYVNSASKESRLRQHVAFSQKCRRYQLMPRSLAVKPLVPMQEGQRVAARASRHFLAAHIQHCYSKLRRLETDMFFQKRQLEYTVGQQHFTTIEDHKKSMQTKVSYAAKNREKKFDALLLKKRLKQKPDERFVVNLSSKQLTTPQMQVLSKGLNFALTQRFIPTLWRVWRQPSPSQVRLRTRPPEPR